MFIKPEVEKFARIKVIGVGGGGCNAIASMIENQNIQGVDFIAVNTDAQHLQNSPAPVKIAIGENLTNGLGAGGIPEIGRKAAEESSDQLQEHLNGSDMIFITAGMGGGTGTGAAPVIANIAKSLGILTVGVVTKPFVFEGNRRLLNAEEGIERLKKEVDALITIPNQRLLEISDQKLPLLEAFRMADSVLGHSVQGISDIIVMPGLINRDFADVKSIMSNAGSALMGIGYAEGEGRSEKAAHDAINSPLLEASVEGAKGILINITGSQNLTLQEVDEAARVVSEAADPDANIIFGATIDEGMQDKVKITIIATGFDERRPRRKRVAQAFSGTTPEDTSKETLTNPESETNGEKDSSKFDTPAFLRR